MQEYTRVVVIGGGIVGAYMLYHLTNWAGQMWFWWNENN